MRRAGPSPDRANAVQQQRTAISRIVWNGTPGEAAALVRSVRQHCTCKQHEPLCPAHMVLLDQRALDALVRRRRRTRMLHLTLLTPYAA